MSKACKPDNFELHNSLELSFTNIRGFRSNSVDWESFLESNSPHIVALCETNVDSSIDSGNFFVTGYLPLIREDSSTHAWFRSLCEGKIPFARNFLENSRKLCRFLLMFSTVFTSPVSYFFFLYRSPSSSSCTVFDSISSNVDEVLLINPSAMFLSQMTLLRWLAFLLGSQTVILTVLIFWVYVFLLKLAFVLQWLSLNWEILIILLSQFPLTFHRIHNGMPRFTALLMVILVLIGTVFEIIWKMSHGRIYLNLVLLLLLVNFVSSGGLVNIAKAFLKLLNLHMLIKQKSSSLRRNLVLETYGELPTVFWTKVNLLYLLNSTARRCYLLHLIKQNCLLKTFQRSLILTQLPVFLSRTNLKLHNNISVTPKMDKNLIMNLDLSKAYGPHCIPVVVLKNCEPGRS